MSLTFRANVGSVWENENLKCDFSNEAISLKRDVYSASIRSF